jgi:uncharacterized delta-60 repeat protein
MTGVVRHTVFLLTLVGALAVAGPALAVAGALDTTFGGDGRVTTNFSRGLDSAHGVVVQANGKIVAAGHANFRKFALARYKANGALDSTFSGDGKRRTSFSSGRDFANGVALQPKGRIVAAGRAGGVGGGTFGVVRYLAS